ncbi:aldo/keto reductase [Chitiniphilus purpureus]|uniref:Aldo/keto reductase n=1 Tax=Chitiniphilus purpureus TaxID=2981137 RepID=A0ABY6DJT5_9NEIS|nr:aldo/keto reductase [Chitiniphilus sp. CD1]UXY14615.1 aldo/keto reductase [Chitiniphilus sp. CD1]
MRYRLLPASDLTVSAICLGTMTFGEQNSTAEAHAQLDRALAAGVNFIDTAEMYPVPARAETQGRTEAILGDWLVRQPRDRVVVASKVAGPQRGMAWMRGGPQYTADQIVAACDASLSRLRTDYIDLYQLHWPARHVPMFGETDFDPAKEPTEVPSVYVQLEALDQLVRAGKVRYVGLSNETPWGVMEFLRLAREHGLPRPISIQNVCNLLHRGFEHGLTEVCHREDVGLLAYSPLAFGLLSAKYQDDPGADGRMTRFPEFGARYRKPHVQSAIADYARLAREHGLSPAQLALCWLMQRWYVSSTIIGATTAAQLEENLGCLDLPLDPALLAAIEAIHLRCPNPAL